MSSEITELISKFISVEETLKEAQDSSLKSPFPKGR
jgi:hypothetical protein